MGLNVFVSYRNHYYCSRCMMLIPKDQAVTRKARNGLRLLFCPYCGGMLRTSRKRYHKPSRENPAIPRVDPEAYGVRV